MPKCHLSFLLHDVYNSRKKIHPTRGVNDAEHPSTIYFCATAFSQVECYLDEPFLCLY